MSYDKLQGFFESTTGQIISVAVLVILFAGVLLSGKKQKTNTKTMVVSALLVGLSIVLTRITIYSLPQGGSVSLFGMLPIVICAYFFGTRRAVMCGMCVGMIDLIFKPYVIHPIQLLLDYPLAFAMLGLAGLANKFSDKWGMIPGIILGTFGRFVCAFLSGMIFFGMYAPEGQNLVVYSIVYNGLYLVPEAIICIVLALIPQIRQLAKRLALQD